VACGGEIYDEALNRLANIILNGKNSPPSHTSIISGHCAFRAPIEE